MDGREDSPPREASPTLRTSNLSLNTVPPPGRSLRTGGGVSARGLPSASINRNGGGRHKNASRFVPSRTFSPFPHCRETMVRSGLGASPENRYVPSPAWGEGGKSGLPGEGHFKDPLAPCPPPRVLVGPQRQKAGKGVTVSPRGSVLAFSRPSRLLFAGTKRLAWPQRAPGRPGATGKCWGGTPPHCPPTLGASSGWAADRRLRPAFPSAGRAWRGRPPRTKRESGKWTEASSGPVVFGGLAC